jgi:hypothetical protein
MTASTYSDALKELAPTRPIKRAIGDAAHLAGLTYTRAFDIWYAKARRIDAEEADKINEAVRLKREKAARNEYQELRNRLVRLESLLVQKDPNFHR